MNPAQEARAMSSVWEQNQNELRYDSGTMAVLLEHTLLEAHDPSSGRYDAVRVGHSLSLSAAEMALVVGWTPRGIRKKPASPKLQEPLTRLIATVTLLRELLDGSMPYVRVWLRAPHPALGRRTPLSYLLDGQIGPIDDLARAIAAGQPD
jgi:Antitoxin Xre/MbcA/ParS C-terminal toxin-binding domain